MLIDREMALPHDAPEAEFDAVAEATERLEQQRQQDWAQYGAALKANVEAAAARRGLRVPVVVNVDLETFRDVADQGSDYGLVWQIVIEAREATPLPGNGRLPLERLEGLSGEHDKSVLRPSPGRRPSTAAGSYRAHRALGEFLRRDLSHTRFEWGACADGRLGML